MCQSCKNFNKYIQKTKFSELRLLRKYQRDSTCRRHHTKQEETYQLTFGNYNTIKICKALRTETLELHFHIQLSLAFQKLAFGHFSFTENLH